MTLHLIKLAVGVQDISEVAANQRKWMTTYHGKEAFPVYTRRKPRRDAELVKGGSVYRVLKSRIQFRQEIMGIEQIEDDEHGTYCLIFVEPTIIQTVSMPYRPFQGWRYLDPAKAPADRGVYDLENDNPIPPEMEAELKELGLL